VSAELLELGTKPISPEAPSGAPARDEPEFAALQLELRKLELPEQPTVNWDSAIKNASLLLGTKSKDLLVASYLTLALFERDGHAGLAIGLTVLRDMLGNFWETLFPEVKRLRGRAAAFEWLSERGAAAVRRRGESGAKPVDVNACLERIGEIGERLSPHLEGGSYMLTDLRDALQEIPTEESAPSPPPGAPAGASAASAPVASAPVSAVPTTLATPSDYDAAIGEAKKLMRMSSDYLRAQEPLNPLAFRMPRFATWMTVKLPPATDGKTQIPPPQPPDMLEKLTAQMANGQFAGVLETTEGRFPTAVFWLDLHRFAAQALERMGPDAKPAADAVREETAALLRRLPGLQDLRFSNDQPVANPETREWITKVVLAAPAGGDGASGSSAKPAEGEDADTFETVRAEARALAREKKLAEALRRLEAEAMRAGPLRDRVRWKLESARLCSEAGHPETALAQLEGLDQAMRDANVEAWDPVLSVEVLRQLLLARQRVPAAGKSPEDMARGRELLGRLCRLDVVAALELNGKK
jgi:type VI secretion system protein VasJ